MTHFNDSSSVDAIYPVLARHQLCEEWTHRELMSFLQHWRGIVTVEFKLDVPNVALSVERLPCNRLGHFRPGHNGFGLRGEIAINEQHLQRERWRIIGTLTHEILHGWQDLHGKPSRWHHNTEFRAKAESIGLIVDRRGVTLYRPNSPFVEMLKKHGVDIPADLPPVPTHRDSGTVGGSSKLKKWSCGCLPPVNVRVAVADFRAQCLNCQTPFRRAD